MLELGFEIIDLEKVRNNNYNLVGSSYRKIIKNKDIKSFFDLLEDGVITGKKGNMITKNTANNGNIPVIAAGQTSPYSHNQYNFSGNIITISSSGAYAGYVWYHNSPIWASDCSVVYSTNEKLLLTKYLYYILKSQQNIIYQKQSGSGQPHVYLKDLKNLQIPLHSLEEQQKIVEELNSYQQIHRWSKTDNR